MEINEIQIWQLWSTASIAMALRAIASILLFWLTLRIANNIRTSGEENLIAKLLTTALGGFVIFGLHFWQTSTANIYRYTANSLSSLKDSGTEITAAAAGFVETYGGAGAASPGPLIIVFDVLLLGNYSGGSLGTQKDQLIISKHYEKWRRVNRRHFFGQKFGFDLFLNGAQGSAAPI